MLEAQVSIPFLSLQQEYFLKTTVFKVIIPI